MIASGNKFLLQPRTWSSSFWKKVQRSGLRLLRLFYTRGLVRKTKTGKASWPISLLSSTTSESKWAMPRILSFPAHLWWRACAWRTCLLKRPSFSQTGTPLWTELPWWSDLWSRVGRQGRSLLLSSPLCGKWMWWACPSSTRCPSRPPIRASPQLIRPMDKPWCRNWQTGRRAR